MIEGKTPEITIEQARTLLASIGYRADVVGLRDRAILATLAYTACRAGAVAKLRLGDFQSDGHAIRAAVSGKGRQEPGNPGAARSGGLYTGLCRGGGHRRRCQGLAAVPGGATAGRRQLTGNAMTTKRICELVKRRLKDAGLPLRLSPHSFRVTAITDLLDARGAARGCAIPGRARGAANDRALRPAAEEGDAEYRRADFDLDQMQGE